MAFHISIDVGEATAAELDALAALVASLRGHSKPSTSSIAAASAPASPPPVPVAPAPPAAVAAIETPAAVAAIETPDVPTPPEPEPGPTSIPEGVDVDSAGVPWDARIHAATQTKVKDGAWRGKKGVEAAYAERVTEELRALMSVPVPVTRSPEEAFGAAAPLPPTGSEHAGTAFPGDGAKTVAEAAAPPPPPAVPAPPAGLDPPSLPPWLAEVSPAPPARSAFADIMRDVTARQAAGSLTTEAAMQICAQVGVKSVTDLAARPDLIPAFRALLP